MIRLQSWFFEWKPYFQIGDGRLKRWRTWRPQICNEMLHGATTKKDRRSCKLRTWLQPHVRCDKSYDASARTLSKEISDSKKEKNWFLLVDWLTSWQHTPPFHDFSNPIHHCSIILFGCFVKFNGSKKLKMCLQTELLHSFDIVYKLFYTASFMGNQLLWTRLEIKRMTSIGEDSC